MFRRSTLALATLAPLVIGSAASSTRVDAATRVVKSGESAVEALSHATSGDTLRLAAGIFSGDLVFDKPGIVIEGEPGAVVQGGGKGNAITIRAPDVAVRRLTIRGSGLTLIDKNSGIFVDRGGDRARIEDNFIEGNLISVYLDGPRDAVVRGNRILGLERLRRTERGPAVSIWNSPGSVVEDNDVRFGRDGVFAVASRQNVVRNNRFRDVRFAVHFMYTNDTEVAGNLSVGDDVGYVMMYSDRLQVHDNVSERDRDSGLLFNYANEARVEGNVVRASEKCVFIYNANKNVFSGNWFEGCRVGVHFTAGSERNTITENAFIDNRSQVLYVGTRFLDWSANGRGNFYSDNPAFDLKGTGVAETPYRPNDLMDQVIWRAPAAKMLLNSPAVQVVRWAQSQFPAIHPGGVIDSHPLMAPRRPPALARLAP